jgi:outer membrane protein assembly factor BamB
MSFSFDLSGKEQWTTGSFGTVAATTMLTNTSTKGAVLVGGFDGFLRAFAQDSGKLLWKFGTKDHIYASPAQLSDGTIIQPGADGTLYAIDPGTGKAIWEFDTLEPIRSSPAVDGDDNIYFGNGEGKLYCINPDGTLRWSYKLITDDRNDLNGSPHWDLMVFILAVKAAKYFLFLMIIRSLRLGKRMHGRSLQVKICHQTAPI